MFKADSGHHGVANNLKEIKTNNVFSVVQRRVVRFVFKFPEHQGLLCVVLSVCLTIWFSPSPLGSSQTLKACIEGIGGFVT